MIRSLFNTQPSSERSRTHAVVFDDPETTVHAVEAFMDDGFVIENVHSPFPVPGIDDALGLKETRLPIATFLGGAAGLILAAFLQVWTHTVDWPLDIGGKSNLAWPALVPVGFELTILLAAIATVATLLLKAGLLPTLKAETPSDQPIPAVSDDKFVVLVCERDGRFSTARFLELTQELSAIEVIDSWRVV